MSIKKRHHVYVVTHRDTVRHYVGKTNDPSKRWWSHKNSAKLTDWTGGGYRFARALRKYGSDAFMFQVVETFDTEQEAFEAEEWWVGYLRSVHEDYGFNIEHGGLSGKRAPASTRQKISEAKKRNPVRYWLGKKLPPDMLAKTRTTRKPWSAAHRANAAAHLARMNGPVGDAIREKAKAAIRARTKGERLETSEKIWATRRAKGTDKVGDTTPREVRVESAQRGWVTRRANMEAACRNAGNSN